MNTNTPNIPIASNFFYPSIIIFLTIIIRLSVIGNMDLIAEEAYYWNYANHLDFSYFDHPPMVAYLIKISTILFGTNEIAVRLPGIACWGIASFFIYKLSNEYKTGSGIYALLMLATLPFFFIQSVIMTPDLPLLAAWSASLYYFYQALVKDKQNAWFKLGICFGLGMLSKYTIILLVPATFIYLLLSRTTLKVLRSPYPYIASLIAIIIFSPVIYWNAKHAWASFLFQSTRRFNEGFEFSLHEILGLFVLFLTPLGIYSFFNIFKSRNKNIDNRLFIQVYSLFPLIFFCINSIFHETKFNWIGTGLIAVIPWLACEFSRYYKRWRDTTNILIIAYLCIFICIMSGKPETIYNQLFAKFSNWENFYSKVKDIAHAASENNNQETVIIPIDKYNLASLLSFYQAKNKDNHLKIYGRNIFGQDALMYGFWYKGESLANKNILVLHPDRYMLDAGFLKLSTKPLTPVKVLWGVSPDKSNQTNDYFYQIVTMHGKKDS